MELNNRKNFWAKLRVFFRKLAKVMHDITIWLTLVVYILHLLELTGFIRK